MTDRCYEIRLAARVGPLMRSALAGLDVSDAAQRTRVVGACDDPATSLRLLWRLHALGLEVDRVRVARLPPPGGVDHVR